MNLFIERSNIYDLADRDYYFFLLQQLSCTLLFPLSSAQWDGYPQILEYLDTGGEKDNIQPVYWEQYYSDIEYDDENKENYPRQLHESLPEGRDKRRQVLMISKIN